MKNVLFCAALAVGGGVLAPAADAAIFNYYVGRDGLQTLPSGTYGGLPNPNFGRVQLLYAHPNDLSPSTAHYHGIGAYSYTGPASSPTVLATNANNRLPEISTGQAPLTLAPGGGVFAGKLVSGETDENFGDIHFRSVDALDGFAAGTPEHFMFNSSGGRWNGTMAGATVALKLVGLTPGLHVANESGLEILTNLGDTVPLSAAGAGDDIQFRPVLWADSAATPGTYSVSFQLVETSLPGIDDGGTFHMDFQVVPEPASLGVVALAGLTLLGRRRRKG